MRFSRAAAFLVLFFGFQVSLTHGQVVATWTDGTGNWSNAANWSTNPVVPNNGGGTTYSVTVSGQAVTMDVPKVTIDNLVLVGSALVSGTSLTINTGNSLTLASGGGIQGETLVSSTWATLFNNGTLNINGGTLGISGHVSNNGTLNNHGDLFNIVGLIDNSSAAVLNNYGTLENFEVGLDSSGVINNMPGATISNGLGAFFNAGGTITNYGNFSNTASVSIGGTFTNYGTINNNSLGIFNNSLGSNFINVGTINNDGAIFGAAGAFTNYGTITNSDGGTFGDVSINTGTINNNTIVGIVPTFGSVSINTGTINNSGTFGSVSINTGAINNTGTINNTSAFLNSGAVTISSPGLFTTSANYTQTAGSTLVNGTLSATGGAIVNVLGGTLSGTGTINGNVLMAGITMPGDAPGTLTIFGNYEETGTGFFDELMSPYSRAFLDVSGNVVLDPGALLEISLLGGFNPLGSTISIMDFSTLSGHFANGSSFWDDGFLWDITYRQHEIDVTAVQAPEPSSLLLLALGSLAIGAFVKRKRWHNGSLVGRLT